MNGDYGLPLDGEILPPVLDEPRATPAFVPAVFASLPKPSTRSLPDLRYFQSGAEKSKSVGFVPALGFILLSAGLAVGLAMVDWSQEVSPASSKSVHVTQLTSRVEMRGSESTLFVDGTLRNSSNASQALPPLRVRVISRAGNVQFFPLHAASAIGPIAPGAETVISARYPIESDGVRSVSIIIP